MYDESATNKIPAKREMVYFPLQRSVSVRNRAEIIITHTPSRSDACPIRRETYCQPSNFNSADTRSEYPRVFVGLHCRGIFILLDLRMSASKKLKVSLNSIKD